MLSDYMPMLRRKDEIVQIADFAEIECLRRKNRMVSAGDIRNIIIDETGARCDSPITGDDEDQLMPTIVDAFKEMETRATHCGCRAYPFIVKGGAEAAILELNSRTPMVDTYLFMLLASHRKEKNIGCLRAGDIFEDLSVNAAYHYFDGLGSETGAVAFREIRARHNFPESVDTLCQYLGEGKGFNLAQSRDSAMRFKDNKLDLAVWQGFSDKRPGKLIGFGQCKTGRLWRDALTHLQPEDFIKKWFTQGPVITPVRLFFVASRISDFRDDFALSSADAGIIFDRCRIMECVTNLPEDLSSKIGKWVSACREKDGLLP